MSVRFLRKIAFGSGVGGYEFALENSRGASSDLYKEGSSIYRTLLNTTSSPEEEEESTEAEN